MTRLIGLDALGAAIAGTGNPLGNAARAAYVARAGYVQEPRHLRRWFADLAEAGAAQKNVTVVGDSITVGAYAGGTTPGPWRKNGYVSHLRRRSAALFGEVGPGWAKFAEDDRSTGNGSTSGTTGPMQQGYQIDAGETWTFAEDGPCTGFYVAYWDGGGAFTYQVDGGTAATVTPGGTDAILTRSISGYTDAPHTLLLTGVGTAHISAIRPTRGTTQGVVVNRFGRSGGISEHAAMGAGTVANRTRMLAATFQATSTDLAVIALGANDAAIPTDPAIFRANIKILTDYVTGLGGCSLLVGGPRYADSTTIDALYAQALDLAQTDDHVAYIDLMDLWRDRATTDQADLDFYYDAIHPNSAGHHSYGNFLADAVLAPQPVA